MGLLFSALRWKVFGLALALSACTFPSHAFAQNFDMSNQVAPPKDTGWDPECLKLDQKPICGPGAGNAFAENLRNQIIASPKVQRNQESEFFWNYMIDQQKQTKCEKNMLSTLNLTSNVDDCHNSVSHTNRQSIDQTYPIQSQSALSMQKEILHQVYNELPLIARAKRLCDNAESRVSHNRNKTILQTGADALSANALGLIKDHREYTATRDVAKKDATVACSAYQGLVAKLWSGDTPEMQLYVSVWADRENKLTDQGKTLSPVAFMNEAMPLEKVDHGNQHVTTEYAPADHALAFNDAVIVSMGCRAQARDEQLSKAMQDGHPTNGSNDNTDVRTTLMLDAGNSALSFLNRSKYAVNGAGLACQIKKDYWTIPHRNKMIMQSAEVGVGIAAVVVTGGAAAGAFFGPASALALSAATVTTATIVIDSAAAAVAIGKLFMTSSNTCASVISPETLQPKPICEMFANSKPGQIPQDFSSKLEKRDSCMGQAIEAIMATVGATGAILNTPKEAAELSEILALEEANSALYKIKKAKDVALSAKNVVGKVNDKNNTQNSLNR